MYHIWKKSLFLYLQFATNRMSISLKMRPWELVENGTLNRNTLYIWSGRQVLLRPGRWKRLLKFFSRLFLVDKTFIYENPYEGVWGVLGNSSYKPFYNDLSPLETISNLCFSNFSWKQSKQWTVVGYIYYIIYVTQYIHKQIWWNVFQIMGYAPL